MRTHAVLRTVVLVTTWMMLIVDARGAEDCSAMEGWLDFVACEAISIIDNHRRRLQFGSTSGARYATRSYTPMNKYLREVDLKNRRNGHPEFSHGSFRQDNTLKRPTRLRTSELPYHSGDLEIGKNHKRQVNGLKHPKVKCSNLAPYDPRPCVKQ